MAQRRHEHYTKRAKLGGYRGKATHGIPVVIVNSRDEPTSRPGLSIADGETGLVKWFRNASNSAELNVNGSVTPVVFTVGPPVGQVWMITTISLSLVDQNMAWNLFAGVAALTNGILVQARAGSPLAPVIDFTDGLPIKQNSHLAALFGADVRAEVLTSSDLIRVTAKPWAESGGALRLVPGTDLAITIRDNASGADAFRALATGWIEPVKG
jgi:hypothetical protein